MRQMRRSKLGTTLLVALAATTGTVTLISAGPAQAADCHKSRLTSVVNLKTLYSAGSYRNTSPDTVKRTLKFESERVVKESVTARGEVSVGTKVKGVAVNAKAGASGTNAITIGVRGSVRYVDSIPSGQTSSARYVAVIGKSLTQRRKTCTSPWRVVDTTNVQVLGVQWVITRAGGKIVAAPPVNYTYTAVPRF